MESLSRKKDLLHRGSMPPKLPAGSGLPVAALIVSMASRASDCVDERVEEPRRIKRSFAICCWRRRHVLLQCCCQLLHREAGINGDGMLRGRGALDRLEEQMS